MAGLNVVMLCVVAHRTLVLALSLILVIGCGARSGVATAHAADPFEIIPSRWIDLPDAPFVAQMMGGKAVLVNRSDHPFNVVETGCVIEDQRTVRVVARLITMDRSHGVFSRKGKSRGCSGV
jgi:hypothetical protein